MSETYILAEVRRSVTERAAHVCEYCLLPEAQHPRPFHVDHVIGEKHLGPTVPENLALACPECNTAKGSDICTVDWPNVNERIRFFDPRTDNWWEHFQLDGSAIE